STCCPRRAWCVCVPAAPLVPAAPATPASDPIVSLNPFKSSVEVPFNVTALPEPIEFTTQSLTPLATVRVVVPVYVLAALSVSVPPPDCVNAPVPLIVPP